MGMALAVQTHKISAVTQAYLGHSTGVIVKIGIPQDFPETQKSAMVRITIAMVQQMTV